MNPIFFFFNVRPHQLYSPPNACDDVFIIRHCQYSQFLFKYATVYTFLSTENQHTYTYIQLFYEAV